MLFKDLNKIPEGYDKVPSIDDLRNVIEESIEESQSIRREAKRLKDNKTTSFICFAIEDLEWILRFFAANKPIFLNELAISRRKYLEIYIDLMWVYKIYLQNGEIAEELCKRFFQVGANEFVNLQSGYKHNPKDLFLGYKDLHEEHDDNVEKAKEVDLIELDPTNGEHDYSKMFRNDWRAHPTLFDQSNKMKNAILHTRDRIKQLKSFFKDHFDIKNPPFLSDYDRLNQTTHWTPFGLRIMSHDNKKLIYRRELNLMTGYLHDALNLIFEYLEKDKIPESIAVIRQKFLWTT